MMQPPGMRFPPDGPIPLAQGEDLPMDEHGNIDWHVAWLKELGHLQAVTQEQEKAQAEQDWYRMMLFRIRTAMMAPLQGETVMHIPGGPPPHGIEQSNPQHQ